MERGGECILGLSRLSSFHKGKCGWLDRDADLSVLLPRKGAISKLRPRARGRNAISFLHLDRLFVKHIARLGLLTHVGKVHQVWTNVGCGPLFWHSHTSENSANGKEFSYDHVSTRRAGQSLVLRDWWGDKGWYVCMYQC